MKTFTVVVSNGKTREPISFCQMSRPRFTTEDYKWIQQELFFYASQGIEFSELCADVYECDMDTIKAIPMNPESAAYRFTVYGNTFTDGTTIDVHILVNGDYVRTMNLAC